MVLFSGDAKQQQQQINKWSGKVVIKKEKFLAAGEAYKDIYQCKAPTLWLKALNKHTRIMYIEMENVIKKK